MAQTDEVLIEVRPGRTRIALLGAAKLLELIVEDEETPSLVGNIYLGRVTSVLGPLNAAFVDIGQSRAGFLALAETRPAGSPGKAGDNIANHLCEGDSVCVQVLRDPIEDKGAKLTTRLSLTGYTVVLTPDDAAIRISRRIDDVERRAALETLLRGMAGPNEGYIARTVALDCSEQDITADITCLRKDWAGLVKNRATLTPPSLLVSEADGVIRALRDFAGHTVDRVVVDDPAAFGRARHYLEKRAPGLLDRLVLHQGAIPLLEGDDGLADDIDQALSAHVALPAGGTVVFSETPALVAIDVNVGGTARGGGEQSALACNMQAAREIARQIRLRNLSGLLVIDFVSMKKKANGAKFLAALQDAVRDDPEQVFIAGFTRLGLVEMTRRRGRPSLGASLPAKTVAYRVLDRLAVEADAEPSKGLELYAGKGLVDALGGPVKAALLALEERLGRKITIICDPRSSDVQFAIVRTDIRKSS